MSLKDIYKTLSWTILSICIYCGGLIILLIFVRKGWSRSASNDTSILRLFFALIFLIGFPLLQFYISKRLKISGHLNAATGIWRSIVFEIVIVFLLLVYISQMGR